MRVAGYSLALRDGRVVILRDGEPVYDPGYCSCGALWPDRWLEDHRQFAAHGRKVFWLMDTGGIDGDWSMTAFWRGPGEVVQNPTDLPETYFGIEQQAQALLEIVPDAQFFVRMNDMPPTSWSRAFPEEMQTDATGRRRSVPSLASVRYLAELDSYIRAVVGYCQRASWSTNIIGYVNFPIAEGQTLLATDGWLFDCAPVMRDGFRDWLRKRYSTDAALQDAWGDATASLEAAEVPMEDSFRCRTEEEVLFWPQGSQVRPERDYFAFQETLFRRYLGTIAAALRSAGPGRLVGIDAFKGMMAGWMCSPIFFGRGWKQFFGDGILSSGTTGMAELLDLPDFDLVVTPHDYRCRWAGFGFSPEGIGDSVALRGKLMLIEEDQRTWVNNERGLFGSPRPEEAEAVFHRNLAASLTHGHGNYLMDVCGGYYQDAEMQKVLERRAVCEKRLFLQPRQETACVVTLIDDRAAMHTDFSSAYADLAVIRQRIWGLDHCGVPSRFHLLEDIAHENFPGCHRLFLLPNCFLSSPERRELIQKKLFRNGNVVVFGPGSGITDGETVAPEHAAALTGMDFELYDYEYPRFVTIDRFDHPLTVGASACEVYGDSLRYGPVLVPWAGDEETSNGGARPRRAVAGNGGKLTSLGSIALDCGKRRPGLAVQEFGLGAAGNGRPGDRGPDDYAVVFTAAMPLPSRLLRELARWSGTHVWNEEDDGIYADGNFLAIHACKPGARTLKLPGQWEVSDALLETPFSPPQSEIALSITGPVTHLFALRKPT